MSMLRNVLTYMGLGPDEDYDDGYPFEPHDPDDGPEERPSSKDEGSTIDLTGNGPRGTGRGHGMANGTGGERRSSPPAPRRAPGGPRRRVSDDFDDNPSPRRGRHDMAEPPPSRPLRAVPPADLGEGGGGLTIRSVPPLPREPFETAKPAGPTYAKPRTIAPQSFGDAKVLADDFKSTVPVIMNLQGVERDLARRLIDFASGICYALDGSMEKIASQVFLLTPQSVEVSDEERRRLEERGYEG